MYTMLLPGKVKSPCAKRTVAHTCEDHAMKYGVLYLYTVLRIDLYVSGHLVRMYMVTSIPHSRDTRLSWMSTPA